MNKLTARLLAYPLVTVLLMTVLACTTTPVSDRAPINDPYQSQPSAYPGRRPSAELMIVDGLVIRPLMLGATAVGTGIFIVTLPFSLLGSNVDQAAQRLVVEPAKFTFARCLGCLSDHGWSEYTDY